MSNKERLRVVFVPCSVFRNRSVSTLEAVTFYLKTKLKLRYTDIARLLNRNDRTIWTSYNRARQKIRELDGKESRVYFPTKLFLNRRLSILEAITAYLHYDLGFSNSEVARMLNRDQSTIFTSLSRARQKMGGELNG